ncbi:hypothetical protein BDN72DRAFT_873158 [Pluteus cervinus]|uniref:Uncharacterized protein n=1 Tax=Pluteus cervinus TaxID=181527 RepID=A0ACD2ZZ22_9AGAR|nr:hypothetical protein BDN72DRAFT_873158 [Pluteus cervinus]
MTKIVNQLTSKMEIGSPMASLYLLGNPDHYTSHTFTPFYWQNYGNKIIGLSVVNDYVFRPKELEHMNLYDFVSHYDNSTSLDDVSPKAYYFIKEHPFCKSQMIRLLPVKKHTIPNFIGATLPRKDQGSREYYCKTMLTLFKPWRTGKHLKAVNDTWDDAFETHKFTDHQKFLLKNFHIRYECLDANDDFFAQSMPTDSLRL